MTTDNQELITEQKQEKKVIRDFFLTTFALKNKNTIYLLAIILLVFGLYSYRSLPKELFPEVFFPTILVNTVYPGNPPLDIENLITRPLEKELETVKNVKRLSSTSSQDVSAVIIEFNTDIDINEALVDVKDAVDKAKSELPDDLPADPTVNDIDFSEFPIININISGDYSLIELKRFADYLQEEIEKIKEISKVNIAGINEREIEINIDPLKIEANKISFKDIEDAIAFENISMSAGELKLNNTNRSIRIIGEFLSMKEIEDIIIKHEKGKIVYLKDVAQVVDGYEEPNNFARLNQQAVVSLQVVKKSGENLLDATDQIFVILDQARANHSIPENLSITLTNDQSEHIRKQLSNLENSMILGILFVVIVLFLFLGTRNALLVGSAIPMSMLISFAILNFIGYRINMVILFGLILALGMLVDNAIVVVENIYRYIDRGYSKFEAARQATGEIAIAIITSTATTLAAFFPLIFWDSLMGEFMKYLPITLIIVLTSSLFVALVVIPVFTASLVKKDAHKDKANKKRSLIIFTITLVISVLSYLGQSNLFGTLFGIAAIVSLLNLLIFNSLGRWFQEVLLIKLESLYEQFIYFVLKRRNPYYFIFGTFLLLVFTIMFLNLRSPNVLFFPNNEPEYINILAELPIGMSVTASDSVAMIIEEQVDDILKKNEKIIKSVLTTVGLGAKAESDYFNFSETPNQFLLTVTFIDYEKRDGIITSDIMKELSNELIGKYADIQFSIEKNQNGPPTGKPINIEISGKDFHQLLKLCDTIQQTINNAEIDGIEGLKIDLDVGMPELLIHIDREKSRRFGLSTGLIASTIRTALFGKEVSDFKVGEDEYPIILRLKEKYRNDISSLMNMKVTFRSQSTGKIMQIPVSAVASFSYNTTYGAVKRKDLNRMITIYSNVIEGYNSTEINNQLKPILAQFPLPEGYDYQFTGEQEEQQESMDFLLRALFIAISLISIILVSQFNSVVKPFIIIMSVVLSTIGVLGGIATFKMDFIVIMTGIGIVSLAGVVVNNAIVLIDYINLTKLRKKKELGMKKEQDLKISDSLECIVYAGKIRLRPVLLTAITTILGLLPMAIGINIDFVSFLNNLDPKIYFGGDMANFWGAFSWTVIFGLTFATFLTLIIVPSMYHVLYIAKSKIWGLNEKPVKAEIPIVK